MSREAQPVQVAPEARKECLLQAYEPQLDQLLPVGAHGHPRRLHVTSTEALPSEGPAPSTHMSCPQGRGRESPASRVAGLYLLLQAQLIRKQVINGLEHTLEVQQRLGAWLPCGCAEDETVHYSVRCELPPQGRRSSGDTERQALWGTAVLSNRTLLLTASALGCKGGGRGVHGL